MSKIVRIGKLSFAEMENYANKKNSNFYESMIAEVVGFAITQKKNLSVEEINQIEINTNFITTNFIPCLNNIFKFLYLYYFPNENIEEINFISPELNKILDINYQEKMQAFSKSELYKFIEAYDYSISNELPFELVKGLPDDENRYVGIKIIPNDIAIK